MSRGPRESSVPYVPGARRKPLREAWGRAYQAMAAHLQTPEATREELLIATGHVWRALRYVAHEELARRYPDDDEIAETLYRAVLDPYNHEGRLFGSTHNAHAAVGLLLRMTAPDAPRLAQALIENWPDWDREFLDHALWQMGVGPKPEEGPSLREYVDAQRAKDESGVDPPAPPV